MSRPVISVRGLGKAYRLGLAAAQHDTFRDALLAALKGPFTRLRHLGERRTAQDEFWALRDVSFDVEKGTVLGVIGRNGAGKSTLFKMLSRITEPTEGEIRLRGRVASLLEVGTGFHNELTGRENIYLNGSILGMKRHEITAKFDQIVDFSGVERFLDTPVKHYSSGMYVRLAFAVAAHLEPEILVVDEVLAVGDAEFQKKCLGKMQEVAADEGRTVLFVSHNMAAVQHLCTSALLLRQGRLAMQGPARAVIQEYLTYLARGAGEAFTDNPERSGTHEVRLTAARVASAGSGTTGDCIAGEPASFELDYVNHARLDRVDVFLTVYNQMGVAVTSVDTTLGPTPIKLGPSGRFVCHMPRVPFPPGEYRIAAALRRDERNIDLVPNALVFRVASSLFFGSHRTPYLDVCTFFMDHEWQHAPVDE